MRKKFLSCNNFNFYNFVSLGILPNRPQSLSAVAYPDNRVMVTWLKPDKNPETLIGYRVYYKTTGQLAFKFVRNISIFRQYDN